MFTYKYEFVLSKRCQNLFTTSLKICTEMKENKNYILSMDRDNFTKITNKCSICQPFFCINQSLLHRESHIKFRQRLITFQRCILFPMKNDLEEKRVKYPLGLAIPYNSFYFLTKLTIFLRTRHILLSHRQFFCTISTESTLLHN